MKHHVCRPTRFLAAGLHSAALLWALSATQPWLMPQLPPGLSSHSIGSGSMLTPADDDEDPQVVLVGEEGHEDQAVQVETFHQDPVVVGGQKIEEESHHHLAANLWTYSQRSAHIKKAKPGGFCSLASKTQAVPHAWLTFLLLQGAMSPLGYCDIRCRAGALGLSYSRGYSPHQGTLSSARLQDRCPLQL